jgi:hypothetical protein
MNIQLNNSEILNSLILKISTGNDFKFWLRRRNTNERLDNGYWFNGTDKYIHIGITKAGSGNRSSQSNGFVIHNIVTEKNQRIKVEIKNK